MQGNFLFSCAKKRDDGSQIKNISFNLHRASRAHVVKFSPYFFLGTKKEKTFFFVEVSVFSRLACFPFDTFPRPNAHDKTDSYFEGLHLPSPSCSITQRRRRWKKGEGCHFWVPSFFGKRETDVSFLPPDFASQIFFALPLSACSIGEGSPFKVLSPFFLFSISSFFPGSPLCVSAPEKWLSSNGEKTKWAKESWHDASCCFAFSLFPTQNRGRSKEKKKEK